MEQTIFTQLTLVLVIAAGISLLMRVFKQPLIMGYILTGILVGPAVLDLVSDSQAITTFSQIGITLLLFIIGLGLNPSVIRSLGRPVLLTAGSILLLVGGVGLAVTQILGFNLTEGLILGLGLFFSSTIIILKVISDKRELSRLYAQLSIGVIVVDDIVATLAILTVAAFGTAGGLEISDLLTLLAKGGGLALALFITGVFIMPRLSKLFAHAQELLFLFAVAWAFGISSLSSYLGFSYEVGALFAGVSLASLPYAMQMSTRLKPLRDFFIVLFFVHLGETFAFGQLSASIVPALLLSVIVLLGKPLAIMATLGALGYTRLTGFKAGIHLSQISEFSIILVVFAASVGLVSDLGQSIVTLVTLITIGASTYLMKYDDAIYKRINGWLHIFEHDRVKEAKQKNTLYASILFGYSKGGHEFLATFRELKQRYLVVDYDPEIIEYLSEQGVRNAYGDATDVEFLEEINVTKAELVVSTITEHSVNISILSFLRQHKADTVFICHAGNLDQARELYQLGAAHVMLPHFIGSERVSVQLKKYGVDRKIIDQYRLRHMAELGIGSKTEQL
jgi:Kef-type K+ transport system membrane component KefB